MSIAINDDLRIVTSSAPEFTIQRRKFFGPDSKKHGQEYWVPAAHYGRLDQALIRSLDFVAADSAEAVTIALLHVEMRKWQHEIKTACGGLR